MSMARIAGFSALVLIAGALVLQSEAGGPVATGAVGPAAQEEFPREPFVVSVVEFGSSGSQDRRSFKVPANRRLVIEAVSAAVNPGGHQFRSFEVITRANGRAHRYRLPVGFVDQRGIARLGDAVRLYADPGTDVTLEVTRGGFSGNMRFDASVSGYLLDPASPSLAP